MTVDDRQRKTRRERLRNEGICTRCGERQADLNKDGTQSVRCRPCSDHIAKIRRPERAAKTPPPKISKDWFELGVESHLDSKEFKAYSERIYSVIVQTTDFRTGTFPTIRQIKDIIGVNHPMNSLLLDALDALTGEGRIVKVGGVLISRYKPTLTLGRKATGVKKFTLAGSHVPRPRRRQEA